MAVTVGIVGAVGTIGSSVLGGITGAGAAKSAANAQVQQGQIARQFQEGVYNTAQTNINPWIQGGTEALGGIEQFLGLPNTGGGAGAAGGTGAAASYNQFTKTPFYTFPLAQNVETMDRAARAKGLGLSTGEVQDLGKAAGNYSATNFGSYLTALQGLSGMGMSGSTQLGNIGLGVGQQVGQSSGYIGNAQAGGILGAANAQNQMFQGIGQGVSQLTNIAGGLFGPGGGTGSSYGPQNNMVGSTMSPSGNANTPFNTWYGDSNTPGMGVYGR